MREAETGCQLIVEGGIAAANLESSQPSGSKGDPDEILLARGCNASGSNGSVAFEVWEMTTWQWVRKSRWYGRDSTTKSEHAVLSAVMGADYDRAYETTSLGAVFGRHTKRADVASFPAPPKNASRTLDNVFVVQQQEQQPRQRRQGGVSFLRTGCHGSDRQRAEHRCQNHKTHPSRHILPECARR